MVFLFMTINGMMKISNLREEVTLKVLCIYFSLQGKRHPQNFA